MISIFVFGSNLRGIHGAGAAFDARMFHGAIEGLGVGHAGSSYALPTCALPGKPLPLNIIKLYVDQFRTFTHMVHRASIDWRFRVTRVGCGLAGHKDHDIAPFFLPCDPSMVQFDEKWQPWLGKRFTYWVRT